MKKKKPTAAQKAGKGLLGFLHGQLFKPAPVSEPAKTPSTTFTGEITIKVDECCLEAFAFAMKAAMRAGLLDPQQMGCVTAVMSQITDQIPDSTKALMGDAVKYACKRGEQRQLALMFHAATSAPSKN